MFSVFRPIANNTIIFSQKIAKIAPIHRFIQGKIVSDKSLITEKLKPPITTIASIANCCDWWTRKLSCWC
ncbi:MAG: hypothetical protein ACTMUP_01425 [cyanobacterium endosymbiont of Rhopalodia musculus]